MSFLFPQDFRISNTVVEFLALYENNRLTFPGWRDTLDRIRQDFFNAYMSDDTLFRKIRGLETRERVFRNDENDYCIRKFLRIKKLLSYPGYTKDLQILEDQVYAGKSDFSDVELKHLLRRQYVYMKMWVIDAPRVKTLLLWCVTTDKPRNRLYYYFARHDLAELRLLTHTIFSYL